MDYHKPHHKKLSKNGKMEFITEHNYEVRGKERNDEWKTDGSEMESCDKEIVLD